jgi:hypothetical protein
MVVFLDAVAVAYAPDFDLKAVGDLDITPAFTITKGRASSLDQSHKCHHSGAIVLITEIGPDDMVKDVRLESLDGAGQTS